MGTHFTPAAMKFLRGLKRNNDRTWFEARRSVYEQELKAPMLALIEEINHGMESFAPDHLRPAPKAMMRIYRDTRFSSDKRPYKHHVAAWWSRHGLEKTSGGGYYVHIAPDELLIAAGAYMPERDQLLAIRRWMSEHHEEFRKRMKQALRPQRGEVAPLQAEDGQMLSRMPKGFAPDDAAGELLRAKSWGVRQTLPGEAALEPSLAKQILAGFKRATPVVDALNEAILGAKKTPAVSLNRLF
ncbi:MAG: DUF2461 domain-containing protein [Acidobacteriaceae bacterium]|nr:DUF2461 domain-containing protein [Acidobacteriaceae bacterium]